MITGKPRWIRLAGGEIQPGVVRAVQSEGRNHQCQQLSLLDTSNRRLWAAETSMQSSEAAARQKAHKMSPGRWRTLETIMGNVEKSPSGTLAVVGDGRGRMSLDNGWLGHTIHRQSSTTCDCNICVSLALGEHRLICEMDTGKTSYRPPANDPIGK